MRLPIADAPQPAPPNQAMSTWPVADVTAFLQRQDLSAAALVLKHNGVNGQDLLDMTSDMLQTSFRMTRFLAEKVLAARDGHLRDASE